MTKNVGFLNFREYSPEFFGNRVPTGIVPHLSVLFGCEKEGVFIFANKFVEKILTLR